MRTQPQPLRLPPLAFLLFGMAIGVTSCNYPGPRATLEPTPGQTPTSPSLATLPTAAASNCVEGMTVLSESGYLDATPAGASQTVERVWHVRNTGTCTWTPDYALVPVEGDSFGKSPVPLAETVAPNEETDLRLPIVAPSSPGFYAGGWALRSPEGAQLGAASRPLRVRVNVGSAPADPTREVYNFAEHMCEARWVAGSPTRSGRLLPCPGYDRDHGGSVVRLEAPRFSSGALEDEPGLVLHPPVEVGGLISGTYPPYSVQAGDQFRVLLGCGAGPAGCQARFQLNAREGELLSPVAEWVVTGADAARSLVVDLSFLAGRSVAFVLGVDADGSGASDAALWVQPRIVH
jgi:hypothetical protein